MKYRIARLVYDKGRALTWLVICPHCPLAPRRIASLRDWRSATLFAALHHHTVHVLPPFANRKG